MKHALVVVKDLVSLDDLKVYSFKSITDAKRWVSENEKPNELCVVIKKGHPFYERYAPVSVRAPVEIPLVDRVGQILENVQRTGNKYRKDYEDVSVRIGTLVLGSKTEVRVMVFTTKMTASIYTSDPKAIEQFDGAIVIHGNNSDGSIDIPKEIAEHLF